MGKKTRRKFTDEFKAETVRLVHASNKGIAAVSRDLGLTETAVRRWVGRAEAKVVPASSGMLTIAERAELDQLRREVRTLRMERDILKKATAFFARESV